MDIAKLRAMAIGDAADFAFTGQDVAVDYEDGYFVIQAPAMEGERVRLVPGARYNRKEDLWVTPATRSQAAAISGVFGGRLASTDAAKERVAELFAPHPPMPDPILCYSGPYESKENETEGHLYLHILCDGVPSVVPHTETLLQAMLAAGAQYAGTEPRSRYKGEDGEQPDITKEEALERIREAVRQARTSPTGGVDTGSPLERGNSSPHQRRQGGQSSGESGGDDPIGALPTSFALFEFQQEDVSRLCHEGSVLVGSEMGCGKSPIAAVTLWLRGPGPHLVICPNSMKYKWAKELEIWSPGLTPVVIDGNITKRRKKILKADLSKTVFVINYESLRSHTRLAPWGGKALTDKQKEPKEFNEFSWNCVVSDESHKLKDPKAQQSMAVKQMGLQAKHRIAMSGTPLLNNPDDLWSIGNFIAPEEWGSRNTFRNRYCRTAVGWHSGIENLGLKPETMEEFDRFFQPRFLRRTKKSVLPQLPDKLPLEYIPINMGTKQEKVYNDLVDDMMAVIKDELLIAENPLSLTIRLRQAACAMLTMEEGRVVGLEAPSNKLDAIKDLLSGSSGDPWVIYAESRKFVEFLARELEDDYRIGMITGAHTPKAREKAVERFQAGKLDIMFGTIGAGAEGITLTRAKDILMAQQSWSHGMNAQVIDRVHRIGQNRGVVPRALVSLGTIDEAVAMADLQKETKLQQVVRDPDWWRLQAKGGTFRGKA